jgi:hypothetical protein
MNKIKLILITGLKVSVLFLGLTFFTGCDSDDNTIIEDVEVIDEEEEEEEDVDDGIKVIEIGEDHEDSDDYVWDNSSVVQITLNGSSISVDGSGATVSGSTVTISSAGNYEISGTLSDGQIQVNTEDKEAVRLILNGINVTNTTSSPIYISNAKKTIIILSDNTTNYLTDSANYVFIEGVTEPNATLFSHDDFTIYGSGELIVDANYNDGIASKDGLVIANGTINVNAVDDGIKGKDYMVIKDGNFTINAEGDAIKASNNEDLNGGWIQIESGTFNISTGGNGIIAESALEIEYGDFTIESGGGKNSYLSTDDSAKGIKSTSGFLIEDGIFNINSSDDCVYSSEDLTINDGDFLLETGDDAIHSDETIVINGGEINITTAVEGIESPSITINDGDFYLQTSDDAINAAGSDSNYLYINGGYLVLNAAGDGLDSNGDMFMTGGTVIINGPTAQDNSPIDADGTFKLDGGFLIGSGYGSTMDHAGNTTSNQNSVVITLSSTQSAGSLFHIEDSSGNTLVTFKPEKNYKSIVFSSTAFVNGTYKIYLDGSSTGTETDGVYENGNYTSGTLYKEFTVSSVVTSVN